MQYVLPIVSDTVIITLLKKKSISHYILLLLPNSPPLAKILFKEHGRASCYLRIGYASQTKWLYFIATNTELHISELFNIFKRSIISVSATSYTNRVQ